jgi:hypothetical protein
MRVLLLLMISVLSAAPVFACYNDTSVDRGEKEFRSQYNSASMVVVSQNIETNPWGIGAMCVGSALATGSLFIAIGRFKRKPQ